MSDSENLTTGLSTNHMLDTKLSQLQTLLFSMYGVSASGFEDIGPAHRDNLVWLAYDLSSDCMTLFEKMSAEVRPAQEGAAHG